MIPYQPKPLDAALRILGSLTGGIVGSLIIMAIFLVSSEVLQAPFQKEFEQGEVHSLFIFIFMAMMFVSVTVASIIATALTALSERGKYQNMSSALYQIFIINIIIFIFTAPFYVLLSQIQLKYVAFITGLHILLSALASTMILEIIGNAAYAVLGIYSVVFGLLTGIGFNMALFQTTQGSTTLLLFSALPLIWFFLGLFGIIVEWVYYGLYKVYGVDFLRTDTKYGADLPGGGIEDLTEEEKEEMRLKKKKDETGAEFLSHTGKKL